MRQLVAVPVDAGKRTAMVMLCGFIGRVLLAAVEFAMTPGTGRGGASAAGGGVAHGCASGAGRGGNGRALPAVDRGWTVAGGWQVLELNPAHVTAQRWVNRQRRVKAERVDRAAIADVLLAGRATSKRGRPHSARTIGMAHGTLPRALGDAMRHPEGASSVQ